MASGVDKDGHYHELRGDRAHYMSCLRCGMEGDHWDPYCPNPINDPPESKESGAACLSWKYILNYLFMFGTTYFRFMKCDM